jgi:hypothetical protein
MRSNLNNWTVGRALRLIVGLAALVQAILQKDPVNGLMAVFLLGTAATNLGCGGAVCSVHSKTIGTEKINYESLDTKK